MEHGSREQDSSSRVRGRESETGRFGIVVRWRGGKGIPLGELVGARVEKRGYGRRQEGALSEATLRKASLRVGGPVRPAFNHKVTTNGRWTAAVAPPKAPKSRFDPAALDRAALFGDRRLRVPGGLEVASGFGGFTAQDKPSLQSLHQLPSNALLAGAAFGQFREAGESLFDTNVEAIQEKNTRGMARWELDVATDSELGETSDKSRLALR